MASRAIHFECCSGRVRPHYLNRAISRLPATSDDDT